MSRSSKKHARYRRKSSWRSRSTSPDLHANAVSWRRGDRPRVDILWSDETLPAGPWACGLVATIARDRGRCAALMDPREAMRAGVAEIDEWLARTYGDLPAALSGYAGGNAGLASWRSGERTDATRFAYLFAARARRLGWSARRPSS